MSERQYCGMLYPHGHICSCDIPRDEHDVDPKWHECSECGREWHDDDFKPLDGAA